MPRLTTDDGRTLAWHETGSGPPLLCHPGGPGFSSRAFGTLTDLAAERTLLLLDPRGAGESDRPADPGAYDLEHYAADVEAVREHLGLERIDLLGHSHGGFVAIMWAGTYPERVRRLVLASTTPRFSNAIREARRQRVASHAGKPYFEDAMHALVAHQEGRFANDEELAALYEREGPLFAPAGADSSELIGTLSGAGTNADALKHFNECVSNEMDLRPLLPRIEAETLVITGDLDPLGHPAAAELADALQNATLVIMLGADHFPYLERDHRTRWSRAVLDFLGR